MPLVITCKKCKRVFALSEDERKVFWELPKEERGDLICPDCCEEAMEEDHGGR